MAPGILCLSSVSVFFFSPSALAGRLDLSPRLEIGGIYSDNIYLAPAGAEKSEFLTETNPGFSLAGTGRRYRLNTDYSLHHYQYSDISERDQTFHELDLDSNFNLVKHYLFIDADVNVRQQLVEPTGKIPSNKFSITNNQTDEVSSVLSPYFIYKNASGAEGWLRYSHNAIRYDSGSLPDSDNETASLGINNDVTVDRLKWGLDYYNSAIEYENTRNVSLEKLTLQLGYQFTPHLTVRFLTGYEINDYPVPPTEEEPEGAFWGGVLYWDLSKRSSVMISSQERYVGKTYKAYYKYTDFLTMDIEYLKDITTSAQQHQPQNVNPDSPSAPAYDYFSVVPEVFVQERLDVSLSAQLTRNSWRIYFFNEQRAFQQHLNEADTIGGGLGWARRLTRRMKLDVSISVRDQSDSSSANDWEETKSAITFSHRLGKSSDLKYACQHLIHESVSAVEEYKETTHSIYFGLRL